MTFYFLQNKDQSQALSLQQMDATGEGPEPPKTLRSQQPVCSRETHVVDICTLEAEFIVEIWFHFSERFPGINFIPANIHKSKIKTGEVLVTWSMEVAVLFQNNLYFCSPRVVLAAPVKTWNGVNSMVDGHAVKGCFFALWLKSRIFCFLGVLEPIRKTVDRAALWWTQRGVARASATKGTNG